ncbi:MAG: hypothetical protein ACI361_08540 [Atopobiaceae bacterium]
MSRLFADRAAKKAASAEQLKGKAAPEKAAAGMPAGTDLSKLTRLQLLELLKDAVAENERLKKELAETKKQLEDKRIAIEDSESLAEASLRLAGVFAAAQRAIDLYGYNMDLQRAEAADAEEGYAEEGETSAEAEEDEDASDAASEEAFDE